MIRFLPLPLLLFWTSTAFGQSPRELIRKGADARSQGDVEQALHLLQQAAATATNDTQAAAAAAYGLGVLEYESTNTTSATEHFKSALRTEDMTIQRDAYHNQGNLRMKAAAAFEHEGKLEEAGKEIETAIKNYDNSLMLDPAASDARANLELALKYQQEVKEKQQEQQQQNQKQDKQEQQQQDQQKNEKQDPSQQDQNQQQYQQQQDQQKQDQSQQQDPSQNDPANQQEPSDSKESKSNEPMEPDPQQQEQASDFTQQDRKTQSGEMTPEEARQLLDAQREEEKAIRGRFKVNYGRPERVLKDY